MPPATPVTNKGKTIYLLSVLVLEVVINVEKSCDWIICLEGILILRFLSKPRRVHLKLGKKKQHVNYRTLVALLQIGIWFRSAIAHLLFRILLAYYLTWVISSSACNLFRDSLVPEVQGCSRNLIILPEKKDFPNLLAGDHWCIGADPTLNKIPNDINIIPKIIPMSGLSFI